MLYLVGLYIHIYIGMLCAFYVALNTSIMCPLFSMILVCQGLFVSLGDPTHVWIYIYIPISVVQLFSCCISPRLRETLYE